MLEFPLAVLLRIFDIGQSVFKAYPVGEPPQSKSGVPKVTEFSCAVKGSQLTITLLMYIIKTQTDRWSKRGKNIMRRIKEPEVRKTELLDAAQKLFIEKGYAKTTVTDMLNVHGLSKGVFYYYFKSKEEVMDAIIMRIVSADVAAAKEIADNPDLPAIQKLFQILFAQKPKSGEGKEQMTQQFHHPGNAEMHQFSGEF